MNGKTSQLILFPTVASRLEGNQWLADVHGWRYDYDEEEHFQRTGAGLLRRALKIEKGTPDPDHFRERANGFVVDNQKKTIITISDRDQPVVAIKTKRNGHFKAQIQLTVNLEDESVRQTTHGTGFVSLSAQDKELSATGPVHLLDQEGLSVVSDIDDTIKFSNVGNRAELLSNTFLRPFRSIEGMRELYRKLSSRDASFHYISATPWQMFGTVTRFLAEEEFPEGSVHLRKFAIKDMTFLKKIFPAYKKKRKVIESLFLRYPQRKFLLFGDSGEHDPEIYGDLGRKYPDQLLGICIRNVTHNAPESFRYRRAFMHISAEKWHVFEDALRLETQILPDLLEQYQQSLTQPTQSISLAE